MFLERLLKQYGIVIQGRKEKINRRLIFLGVIVFRISLDIAYKLVISKDYGSFGFFYRLSDVKLIVSYIAMIVVLVCFVPQVKIERPASILLLTLLLMAFIPNMSLFAGMDLPYTFLLQSTLFWLSIAAFYSFGIIKRTKIGIRITNWHFVGKASKKNNRIKPYIIFLLAFAIVVIYSIRYNNGFSLRLNLNEAYDLRLAARGNVGNLMLRVLSWSGSIIFPLGIIMAVKKKNLWLLAIMIIGEIAAYAVNGTKTWIFAAALSFLMAVFVQKASRISWLPFMFSIATFFGTIFGVSSKIGSFVNNYIVRRVFFSTSLTNYYWIDFFETNPKLYFTNSILGWIRRFVTVPYDVNVANIIATKYYGNPLANASSGTIACAYANLGWIGLIIYPLVTVAVVEFLDKVSENGMSNIPILFFYPLIISAAEYLLNGSIFTAVITYGYLAGLLIILYLKYQGMFENGT